MKVSPIPPFIKSFAQQSLLTYSVTAALLLEIAAFPAKAASPSFPPDCQSDQIEIGLVEAEAPYNGVSQDKATLFFRNISDTDCSLPATPMIRFFDKNDNLLPIRHEKPEKYHFWHFRHREKEKQHVLAKKSAGENATAYNILFWISSPVYATGVCLSPHYLEVALPNMKWRTSFNSMFCGVTASPWYQQSALKAGENHKIPYVSALAGQPESPRSQQDAEPIEASQPGQSALPES